jgi:peptidoglycan/LPS O-acetylase OafA/YrhL
MAPLRTILFSTLVASAFITNVSSVNAFAPPTVASQTSPFPRNSILKPSKMTTRGGGGGAAAGSSDNTTGKNATTDPAAKSKKIRISAFDSMRFFLIFNIVLGHFIKFANPSKTLFRAASQHNVIVGAFFALSGYVAAYTSTENNVAEASVKLLGTPKQEWIVARIFGYYPLHLFVLLLFSPIFLYADLTYNGIWKTTANAAMAVTLTQAWFPQHAEVWNAPTWFLSSLNFATALLPFALPPLAKLNKKQLRKTTLWIWLVYLLPKLGYLYDLNAWGIFEGVVNPKAHPNLALFNMQRFNPVFCAMEVLLGAAACRSVMMDDAQGETGPTTNAFSTFGPLLSILGMMALRAVGTMECSDMLFRSVFFVPLFLRLLMSVHRNTVSKAFDPLVGLLSNPILVWLGNLSFPIFIVHGPLGQVFYKKIIATKLFGQVLAGPMYFAIYLATTFVSALALQKFFLQNKTVGKWSKNAVDSLSSWL